MKKQAIWLSPLLVVVATPVAVISSCATTAENSEFQKTVDQLFNEAKLSLNFNNPIMSEDIFNKYKDQYQEIKKGFKLENKSDLKLDWQITKITEEEKTIKVSILVTDGTQNATQTITLNKSFASSRQFYIDGVYNQIRQNLQLKPEYEKTKLVDLFSKTKTNQDIMDLFVINDYLDVKIELNFLSQTIDRDEPKLKFNVLVKNQADNQFVPPSNVFQPAYSFKNLDLIQPATLLLQSDLAKEHDKDSKIPNGSYFGKTFIIKDQASDTLVFNRNLVAKKITEKLDFSAFKTVEFGDSALLSGNDITTLSFDLSGTVKNLKANLFKSNQIETVELPANVENFNISAFDESVNISNLNQVPDIKTFYDDQNKIIYLNKVVYKTDGDLTEAKEQIKQMLNLVARSQSQDRKTINVNKIVLPNFNFETPYDLNITTQTIEFNSQAINKNLKADQKPLIEKFETDLSRWKIKTINIPASVILINESNLPSSSDENPVTITRELNSNVLDLIKNTTTLDLSKPLSILKDLNYEKTTLIENLASNSMLLDQLFYGFTTPNEQVKKLTKILIKNSSTNNTAFLSMSNFSYYAKFFTQNATKDTPAKTIEIDQSIEKIEMSDFSSFRSSFKGNGVSVVRKKPTSFTWIDENGTFKLNDFQKDKSNQDGYKYLSGLEDQIKSIDTSSATKIDNYQFYGLDFSLSGTRASIEIDLNSVTSIGDYAFYNVDGLTYKMNDSKKWTTVGTYAFYYADLANTIDLSGLTTISDYAFYGNSNVTGVTLSTSLTSIGNSAFHSNKITTLNSLPATLTSIGDYAFAYNDLTSTTKSALDLSNVEKIGQWAFASNANLAAVTVGTKLKDISNYAFQNTGLTSFDFSNVTTIGSSAFSNTKLTGKIDLSKVTKIGSSAFYQNEAITELTLNKDAEIENGAFRNLTKLNKVENFNFTKYNFDDLFDSNQIDSINFNEADTSLESFFHFDKSSKNLDLSSLTTWQTEHTNKFKLFLKTHKEFKDVTLPKVSQQDTNLMNLLQNATKIEKLIWNTDSNSNKTINFSLSNNVKSLDENFVLGAMEIPNYTFNNLRIEASKNQKLNLNTVTKVGDYAFGGNSGINEFISTTNIQEIGSNSFGYQSKLELSADVKMQDSSFNAQTNQALIPPTVTQKTRFSKSEFLTIYDPKTKILDFTKADLNGNEFYDSSKWNKYYNIGDYLLTGEVTKVILPEVYVIWKGFVTNLGQVQEIVFQSTNQSIAKEAFSGTTVVKKPQQNQTNILFDGDNFFSTK